MNIQYNFRIVYQLIHINSNVNMRTVISSVAARFYVLHVSPRQLDFIIFNQMLLDQSDSITFLKSK